MCEPVSIGLAGLSIASNIMQTNEARKQSRAQQAAVQQDTAQQMELMKAQALQISNQADQQKSEAALAIMRAKASAALAAAEGGVSGNSIAVQQNDLGWQGSKNLAQIEANKAATLMQNQLDARGIASRGQSQINQIQSSTPTWIGTGLRIGTTLGGSYLDWNYRNPGKPNPVGQWISKQFN